SCICFVGEDVFSGMRHSSCVEISIGQAQLLRLGFSQQTLIVIQCMVDARYIEILGLLCRNLEVERLERPNLWNELEKKRQHSRTESRTAVALPPLALIIGAR